MGDEPKPAREHDRRRRTEPVTDFEIGIAPVDASFGAGRGMTVGSAVERLGIRRLLLIGTPAAEHRYRHVFEPLRERVAARFFAAAPHCPEDVVERCRALYARSGCDGVVAVGGGSTLGLGKIMAAEQGARFVALPTTYSGSEMTPIYGRKIGLEKRIRRDPRCRPHAVIYDPDLAAGLAPGVVATSGMNSIAHAVEALYPARPDPLTPLLAEQALAAHRESLPAVVSGAATAPAHARALYGGFLGGLLVTMCGTALHHALCHVIGGLFDLPHGATNAAVLPHVVAYNRPAIPAACAVIEQVFEADDAAAALYDFAGALGAPRSLRQLGMPEAGIGEAVERIRAHAGWNPRPLDLAGIEQLVRNAFEGRSPVEAARR